VCRHLHTPPPGEQDSGASSGVYGVDQGLGWSGSCEVIKASNLDLARPSATCIPVPISPGIAYRMMGTSSHACLVMSPPSSRALITPRESRLQKTRSYGSSPRQQTGRNMCPLYTGRLSYFSSFFFLRLDPKHTFVLGQNAHAIGSQVEWPLIA
jgi:hypothetical protein